MIAPHLLFRPHTLDEYRALERNADCKHEFVDGEIIAMPGASPEHCDITLGFAVALRKRLKRPCRVFASDMRVRSADDSLYAYPDVVVACPAAFDRTERPPVLINPRVIVEVLSDSTALYDRNEKFRRYCGLESLSDYVLASQTAPTLEHRVRMADGTWAAEFIDYGELVLRSLEIAVPIAEIYEGVF